MVNASGSTPSFRSRGGVAEIPQERFSDHRKRFFWRRGLHPDRRERVDSLLAQSVKPQPYTYRRRRIAAPLTRVSGALPPRKPGCKVSVGKHAAGSSLTGLPNHAYSTGRFRELPRRIPTPHTPHIPNWRHTTVSQLEWALRDKGPGGVFMLLGRPSRIGNLRGSTAEGDGVGRRRGK
jgi:hypothetical protein